MNLAICQTGSFSEELTQALTDLDMAKILCLIDPRMDDKAAISFTEHWFSSDADEIRERLSFLSALKQKVSASGLQSAIDRLAAIRREEDMLRLSKGRFSEVLFSWRRLAAYVKAIDTFLAFLGDEPSGTRFGEFTRFFIDLKQDKVYLECQKTLAQLNEVLTLPRYVNVGINMREDGFPLEMSVLSVEGHIDLQSNDSLETGDLNALLSGSDMQSPSFALGPEFVYNRSLYGSHFDEYLERNFEHRFRQELTKASKLLSKIPLTKIPELLSLIEPLSYYQIGLLTAEAFESRGYRLCVPDPKSSASLSIKNALYPDFILHNTGIQGNDLLLKKGSAVIITGPNHSGKTSYLKTIGQCYVLAQLGFFVPADSMQFTPVHMMFTLFSAGEDSSMTKSRMGIEVKKLTEILHNATDDDLILLNEPMTSTNPVEAVSICGDLTRHFLEKGITHLLVTHLYDIYYLLKAKLSKEQLQNLESLITQSHYDDEAAAMVHSYRLIAHEPLGNSYARETAQAYGVTLKDMIKDASLLAKAQTYCGEHNIDSIYEGDDPRGLSDNH